MTGYTKLFGSIITSTIWCEDNITRIVWITMLAVRNKDNIVEGSVPGIAAIARVPIEECRESIEKLMAPDHDSRTKDHEGRRIKAVDGGWLILNGEKYRNKMNEDERREYNRIKQAEHRAKLKPVKPVIDMSMTVNHSQSQSALSAQSEAEAEAETKASDHSIPVPTSQGRGLGKGNSKPADQPLTIPEALAIPAFADTWETWVAFRKGMKAVKNWNALFREQLRWLTPYGPDQATEILRTSIRNGWQGLFEPNETHKRVSPNSNAKPSRPLTGSVPNNGF